MPDADLVLQGGGVKGIALAGAVTALAEAGYRFPRIAGSSAGALVAAVVAGLQRAREPMTRLHDILETLDLQRFLDEGVFERLTGDVGKAITLLTTDAVFKGDYLHDWVAGVLRDLGVETFADLPYDDASVPADRRFSLVVTASDVSKRLLVVLPWDYERLYGLAPAEQKVADAVRTSAAIPFVFRPVRLPARGGGTSTVVDAAVLSDYPIGVFDRPDELPPRWPTIGVRLAARPPQPPPSRPVDGPVSLGLAVVETMLDARDALHLDDPCDIERTVFVDTSFARALDFDITSAQREKLYNAGVTAAERFLASWNLERYLEECRRGTQR